MTGSIIAVFERLDLETLRTILAAASGYAEMELIRFDLQPTVTYAPTVPDARIAASFDYLFETKTEFGKIASAKDVLKHVSHFVRPDVDARLFVVTPDPVEPVALAAIQDPRITWFSFRMLDTAISDVLEDDALPEEERLLLRTDERVLLRELRMLFREEGLLGREDAVIVAAGFAYGYYQHSGAYVFQAGRSFRQGLTHLGFYTGKEIKSEVPTIKYREDRVLFTTPAAAARRATGDADQIRVADLIDDGLARGTHVDGAANQVFLLSRLGEPDTVVLPRPVPYQGKGPWVRGHRYVYLDRLREATSTDDL